MELLLLGRMYLLSQPEPTLTLNRDPAFSAGSPHITPLLGPPPRNVLTVFKAVFDAFFMSTHFYATHLLSPVYR